MKTSWKAGVVAVLIGAGAVFAGCGGEARDASAEAPSAAPGGGTARLATAEFSVDGMTCGGCAIATEISVRKLDGVSSVDATFDEATGEGRCSVEYDPEAVGTGAIADAIRNAGFQPTLDRTNGSPGQGG